MKENKKEQSLPNIWVAQENTIYLYKIMIITLVALLLGLLIYLGFKSFSNPIVVIKNQNEMEYYPSVKLETTVGKVEVDVFTKRFLKSLYVWSEYNQEKLLKEITPFVEENLAHKIIETQNQKYAGDLKDKKLSQALSFVEVQVMDDKVFAKIDRVLKIEGVALIVPTELSLIMIKGPVTSVNPMGIYITGITENEGSK